MQQLLYNDNETDMAMVFFLFLVCLPSLFCLMQRLNIAAIIGVVCVKTCFFESIRGFVLLRTR